MTVAPAFSHEHEARDLMEDPMRFFARSITRMHTIPQAKLEELQRTAMNLRFQEHRQSIEILRRLAEKEGISQVEDFPDMAPLLFAHSIYKSYPSSWLDKHRFDLLTRWLDRLTNCDLGSVDVSGCEDIDGWIDAIDEQTPLAPITSSGTTGTLSIIPKDKAGAAYVMELWRLLFFQRFGVEPRPDDVDPVVEVVWPNHAAGKLGHLRMGPLIKTHFTGGDESRFHPLYTDAVSTDLMYLATKMRAAASRGELDRLQIEPKLLARKDEFQKLQQRKPQEMAAFFEKVTNELAGKRIFMLGACTLLYDMAAAGLARGIEHAFASDSVIVSGGGSKGVALPADWQDQVKRFLGVDRLLMGYGTSEISTIHMLCDQGRYHVQPWVIPFVLDPDTKAPLPRKGVQIGRAGFYDLALKSHWGGVITGDEIELDWDTPCACGRTSVHIADNIQRYSEKRGDDKITCAATAEIHDDALSFMSEL